MKILKLASKTFLILFFVLISPIAIFAREVIPGGQTIGMELRTNGLIVTGLYDVKHDGGSYNPSSSDIKRGDKIVMANSQDTKSIEELMTILKTIDKSAGVVSLTIIRDEKTLSRELKLFQSPNGTWKTGLFVKEKILGIGTVTYYDAEKGVYGALGHEIIDNDSGKIYEVAEGTIYDSDVISVKKSEKGKPGEKIAQIDQSGSLGTVESNTKFGIYGFIDDVPTLAAMEVAELTEVKVGSAEIWTVLKGKVVEKFSIDITNLKSQSKQDTKGITFKVTDKRLLNETNGIVQGMSGSPIIQNGKIIGAVTHVLVDTPNSGYGIYLIHMLEESDKLAK